VLCRLFDALVLPVIIYGVEVWGAQLGASVMNKVGLAFLPRLLGVRTATPVLAELGRYPLMVTAATLLCGYKKRLVRLDDERLAKQAFLRSLELGRMAAKTGGYSTLGRPSAFFPYGGSHCL